MTATDHTICWCYAKFCVCVEIVKDKYRAIKWIQYTIDSAQFKNC